MSGADLFSLYRMATQSVFRLETLQRYAVSAESAQFRAFSEGRPLPPDKEVAKSMEVIRVLTAAGRRVHRVHVIDLPLTAYLRYEMAAYAENIQAGEEVSIAIRSRHGDLARLTDDFVLFDADAAHPSVVWMRYDQQGRITSRDYSEAPADVARARRDRDLAMTHAVPLSDFTTLADTG
jgi:hypothetical protein